MPLRIFFCSENFYFYGTTFTPCVPLRFLTTETLGGVTLGYLTFRGVYMPGSEGVIMFGNISVIFSRGSSYLSISFDN